MTDKQIAQISREALHLLADLEQLAGFTLSGGSSEEQRALQLITDAFEAVAPLYIGARFESAREAVERIFDEAA